MDQQLRLARIVLENVDSPNQVISVDLVFQGNSIKRGMEYYGVWRDANDELICPFVLDKDGNVDFGTSYNGDDRVYQLDIFKVPIGHGAQVGWRTEDWESQMRITGITQLV